jgi:two-component system, chemotaxis family, chemotaxis protein CheY
MHTHYAVSGRQGRVLVVDDEYDVRKPIALSLQRAGFETVEAENGEEAMRLLNADDNPLMVDTIICDIRMPKVGGLEAIDYFRSQYPTIPIVVLTGYPDVELAVSLLKQGVQNYLVKPVSRDALLDAVRISVDQHVILKDQFVT